MSGVLEVVQDKVRGCEKCWLHRAGNGPVPYRGPVPAPVVVVGEAPGDVEDRKGEPFVGKSGKLLMGLLKDAGIDPYKHVGYCNVVSCWPGKNKKGYRVPALDEQAACRGNLMMQLRMAGPEVVILAGGTALNAFRSDLKISKDRGRPMVLDEIGVVAVPTYHPAAAARVHHLKNSIAKDLRQARWRWKKDDSEYGWGRWPEDCRLCGGQVEVYDVNGIAWCGKHDPGRAGVERVEAVPTALDLEDA